MLTPNDDERDEQRLLTAFQKGDRAAFDALYDRYAGRLLAFARQLTGCRAEAEDLVQETFVAAYRGAAGFRGGARVRTWLFSIAVRRLRDMRRKPGVSNVSGAEESLWNEEAIATGSPVERAAVAAVSFQAALATLDAPLREAFLLVAAQGMTHKEAAELLDTPVGTVKWRVAEATKRLRAALEEKDEGTRQSAPEAVPARR
jgi:RNA polymerase sigma-70 factor (ECF subfamily)